MDPSSQFSVPTIIDVPELIVTNEDIDFDDTVGFTSGLAGANGHGAGAHNSYWASKLQFFSSSLCYTIGLGNLWRFPYLCYKHAGGAYLAAYSFILLTVGMPLLLMELAFGQYANEGPITIWRISPAFEGIGYSMCLISTLIAINYNLINTWTLQYLLASVTFGPLPWTNCDNSWNSAHCFYKPEENFEQLPAQSGQGGHKSLNCSNQSAGAKSSSMPGGESGAANNGSILQLPGNCSSEFEFDKILNATNEILLPSNEYFHQRLLGLTSKEALINETTILGQWNWNLITGLTLLWLLVFTVLLKNLRPTLSSLSLALSSSTLSNKLALAGLVLPFLALFALLIRALTLPGASTGVAYYVTPEWERLQNIDIWADAITQMFYSLGPCWGGIISLANMNKFHNNFHSNTMLIVFINYLTSLASGLAAFATLGFMANYSGIKINEVVDSGVGFIFQVFPETLAQMPLTNLNAIVFFAILLALGLTNQLTVIETVITTIVDTWPHKLRYRRPLVLMILCASMLLLSLPASFGNGLYLLQMMDAFAGTLTGMLIGILELIAIAWVYGMENFMQDIDDMLSVHRSLFPSRTYWYFMWRYLTPSILFAVLLFGLTDFPPIGYRELTELPSWMSRIGWILSALCASVIPLIALLRFLLSPGGSFSDKLSYLCRPSEDWAPSSYISGPKLINRHQMLDDSDLQSGAGGGPGSGGSGAGRYSACSPSQTGDPDDDNQSGTGGTIYTSKRAHRTDYRDQDLVSNESLNDDDDTPGVSGASPGGASGAPGQRNDLKIVNGKPSYIIPEEDDEDEDEDEEGEREMGLLTSETNV